MKRVLVSWSSGKDSAWLLDILRGQSDVELVALATTFNESVDRVAMHAVRRQLVEMQSEMAGLPLWPVMLPSPCTNEEYEVRMRQLVSRAISEGVTHCAFGDLFLADIRDYRIKMLANTGVTPLFPIWTSESGTATLARAMIESGLRAVITCVDPKQLDRSFVGREFDGRLLDDLPPAVDPCGERGEFHTFCYALPHQADKLSIRRGEIVERDGFVFADVLYDSKTGESKNTKPM